MATSRKDLEPSDNTPRRRPPAATPELREQEMVALAFDLVEKKLRNGTATSQETVHFLKLGSENAKLERERMRRENILLEARTENLNKSDRMEELMGKAVKAFKGYRGEEEPDDEQFA